MRDNIVRFSLNQALLIQVDGEPLRLAPGQYTIAHGGRVRVITLPV
jgi:hypothetical protein